MVVPTRGVEFGNETEIRHVPWYSMSEWRDVYSQIYSENLEDRKKGLESLQVWKARSATLPYAVECSHMILRIQVKDEEQISLDPQLLEEDDISMMYCTAITRFLNQILSVDNKKAPVESMYRLAKRLHIPQWLVKLRHDASHGIQLPPLETLRQAAIVAMAWLRDNYWQNEDENIRDYTPSKDTGSDSILPQLVDMRQSTYLFSKSGCWSASHIQDKYLRKSLIRMKRQFLQENPDYKEESVKHWKLQHAISYMDKQIYLCVKDETRARELLDVVFSSEGFIIDADVLKLYSPDCSESEMLNELPREILLQWKDMLGILHCAQLIPVLMHKLLIKCSSGSDISCNIAALWLNELARAILKLRYIHKLLLQADITLKDKMNLAKYASHIISQKSGGSTSNDNLIALEKKAQHKLQKENPLLATALSLPFSVVAPASHIFMDMLKQAVTTPNDYSLLYMKSLTDLVEGELSEQNRQMIVGLVSTYLGDSDFDIGVATNGTSQIHTVDEVRALSEATMDHQEAVKSPTNRPQPPKDTGGWMHYSHSGGQWLPVSGLGRLPWQHNVSYEDFLLPQVWMPWNQTSDQDLHSPQTPMDIVE